MQTEKNESNPQDSEHLSFLEREAIIASSLGDATGVTAKPVSFWNKVHYVAMSVPAEKSSADKKILEPCSPWKQSAIHRKQLLAAKSA